MSASLTLDKTEVIAMVGDWIVLTPTIDKTKDVTWDFNDKNLIWKTSNPNVAIVNNGNVNIVGKGYVKITVGVHYDSVRSNGVDITGVPSKYTAMCEIIVR